MNLEFLVTALLLSAVLVYGLKRLFDDREAARKANQIDDLPQRLTKYEKALKEAIEQVFEFARATKENELRSVAKAAGVIAKAPLFSSGRKRPEP